MAKLLQLFLTMTLLAFATLAQAKSPKPKSVPQPKLFVLDKKAYTPAQMAEAVKQRKNGKLVVIRGHGKGFEDKLLDIASLDPNTAAKLLNRWNGKKIKHYPTMSWISSLVLTDLRIGWKGSYEAYLKIEKKVFDIQNKLDFLEAQRQKSLNQPKTTKEEIEKIKDKPEVTNKPRGQDRRRPPKPKAEEDRIVEADEGGMLVGKSLKLSDLDGCGAFLKINWDEIMGFVSTPCPGLTGGRVATQGDYQSYCNKFEGTQRHCGPPGPGTEKRIEISGIRGMPFNVFCLSLHFNILASGGDAYNRMARTGKLVSVFKYNNSSRKLECFYVSFAQSKALREQYKNIGPVAITGPKKGLRPAGGAGTPPEPAPPAIKKGPRRPRRNADRSPAFASSTDPSTGETITSVGNPDGSRTVTKTDRGGNILSREKVR